MSTITTAAVNTNMNTTTATAMTTAADVTAATRTTATCAPMSTTVSWKSIEKMSYA